MRTTTAPTVTVRATPKHDAPASWNQLLVEAVNKPGTISAAYSAFHNYSVGNQHLALFQCMMHGIQPGPLRTFKGWQDKGRAVRKGEKAIVLCQPRPFARLEKNENGEDVERLRLWFSYRSAWFVASQTDGEEVHILKLPEWDADRAMAALNVKRIPFAMTNGNVQGYSQRGAIALNPVAAHPLKTTIHELAHEILHQASGELFLSVTDLPPNVREVEAEAVALIVIESLGQPGVDLARGYIQSWLGAGQSIPDSSAQRIFTAADKILRAGRRVQEISEGE